MVRYIYFLKRNATASAPKCKRRRYWAGNDRIDQTCGKKESLPAKQVCFQQQNINYFV